MRLRSEVLCRIDREPTGVGFNVGETVRHAQTAFDVGSEKPACFLRKRPPGVGLNRLADLSGEHHQSDANGTDHSIGRDDRANLVTEALQSVQRVVHRCQLEWDTLRDQPVDIDDSLLCPGQEFIDLGGEVVG